MRIDLYTKSILTVIALALMMIACNQYVHPAASEAQGQFTGIQFYGSPFDIFDSRTGEIWLYVNGGSGDFVVDRKLRLTKPGQPLVLEYDRSKAGKQK